MSGFRASGLEAVRLYRFRAWGATGFSGFRA